MPSSAWRRGKSAITFLKTSVKEISDMAQRLEAAKLLLGGSTYDQIVKAVEISTATISRINRCIQYGSGGYRDTIEKVEARAAGENPQ